jgi:hypothetical protein
LPSVAEHTSCGVGLDMFQALMSLFCVYINVACFYIDTVVKSVLVRANEMHTQMIFIFRFAVSVGHTVCIMHKIFVPFM